ncbi:GAF domain-containing protein [Acinetobacter sp. F16]|uniref:GAF domain-containing protein n=1 Tax=Acinetobacter sp. F16 TaxID=3462438 RepID=UPI0040468BA9
MTLEKESWCVRSIKYLENNYHHLYKNFEALILFMLSAYCLADFTTLKNDITAFVSSISSDHIDSWLMFKNILYSYPFYLIILLLAISIFITRKVSNETKTIEEENQNLKKQIQLKETELINTKMQLNEAEEAIDILKDSNLETSFEIGSKFIAYLFQKWGLTSRECINLYLEVEGHFVLSARYALDAKFTEIHRKQFPIDQGIIGDCWRLKRRFIKNYLNNNQQYIRECIKHNFTEQEVKSFTMKSKSIIGFPIYRDEFEVCGVLIVESTQLNWDFDEHSKLTDEYRILFRQFLLHYEKTINACQREAA